MTRSIAEQTLSAQLEQAGIPFEREYVFAPPRKFRADFRVFNKPVNPRDPDLLIEVEGGTWIEGRHSRGKGFAADCEKQYLAVLGGYRYLRVTSNQVEDGTALQWIKSLIEETTRDAA